MKRFVSIVAAAAACLVVARAQTTTGRPKLAVIIVVDQMRADYVERFSADWSGGFKRLIDEGAWFTNAAFPYLAIKTCPGHATISTGTFPATHGLIGNQWWDRETGKQVVCTEDATTTNIGYEAPNLEHNSPRRLLVDTFADRMRAQRRAHVVTLSQKARSAIALAGHAADAVTWMSERLDTWVTSTAYTAKPIPAVDAFVRANPESRDFGQTWNRLLPVAQYKEADEGVGERPPAGWTSSFPHVLNGTAGKPDASFHAQWDVSPFPDTYLVKMTMSLVDSMQLGKHDGTDVLGLSLSATDRVGHKFGPRSQEIQDKLARLDRDLATLFEHLDRAVGRNEYVVALSADHGITAIPEQLAPTGQGGRIRGADFNEKIEAVLRPVLGSSAQVAMFDSRDMNVYFAPGVYQTLAANAQLFAAVEQAIMSIPGVDRVLRAEQMRNGRNSTDALIRAAALSYYEGRSGDLQIALKPGWISSGEAADHGTTTGDDQRVPILLLGRGVKPGRYDTAATPADIAPTLAALCGIIMPRAEGHALRAAIK